MLGVKNRRGSACDSSFGRSLWGETSAVCWSSKAGGCLNGAVCIFERLECTYMFDLSKNSDTTRKKQVENNPRKLGRATMTPCMFRPQYPMDTKDRVPSCNLVCNHQRFQHAEPTVSTKRLRTKIEQETINKVKLSLSRSTTTIPRATNNHDNNDNKSRIPQQTPIADRC